MSNKFVFILDTSPLMQLKNAKSSCGMNFIHQSVYAIEEFLNARKQFHQQSSSSSSQFDQRFMGGDKYYLFKTLGSQEPVENCVLSGLQHPHKHFMHQLFNVTCSRDLIDLPRSLISIMKIVNSTRLITGDSNRIQGIELAKNDPHDIIFFTAGGNSSYKKSQLFESLMKQSGSYYDEVFEWNQKLHVINFRGEVDPGLREVVRVSGGTYRKVESFNNLKYRMQFLANNCLFTVVCKVKLPQT